MAILAYLCTLSACAANISAATVLECFTDAVSHIAIDFRIALAMDFLFGLAVTWEEKTLQLPSLCGHNQKKSIQIKELKVYGEMFFMQGCTSLHYQLFFH